MKILTLTIFSTIVVDDVPKLKTCQYTSNIFVLNLYRFENIVNKVNTDRIFIFAYCEGLFGFFKPGCLIKVQPIVGSDMDVFLF